MFQNKIIGVGVVSLVVLAGCGRIDKKDSEKTNTPADQRDLSLVGAWERGCESVDLLGLQSHKIRLDFNAGFGFSREQTLFAGSTCADERIVEKQVGTYGRVGDAKDIPGAHQINFTIKDAYVTPRNDQGVADLNKVKYCGIADWAVGVERKVTNIACKSGFNEGQVLFDVYKVEQNSLQLGQAGFLLDGSTDSARPTALNTAKPYVKK